MSLRTLLLLSVALLIAPMNAQAQNAENLLNAPTTTEYNDALNPSQSSAIPVMQEQGSGEDVVAPIAEEAPPIKEALPEPAPVIRSRGKDSKLSGQTYLQETAEQGFVSSESKQIVSNQPLLDALRTAYINNPTLRAARAEMRATAEALPQAQSGWMPRSGVTGTVTTADIDPGRTGDGTTSKELELSVTQPLYRGGRTVSGIGSARNRIIAQGAILNATEQQLLYNVATAYMNVVRDKALVDLSENNISVVDRQLEASRSRFEVGEVTRTDVAQSEARIARAQANRTTAIGNLKSSLAVYEQLVGTAATNLVQTNVQFDFPAQLDEAITVSENNSPLIVASEYLHQSAEKDIGTVFGELLPELGLAASVDKTWDPQPGFTSDSHVKSLSLIATVPLYEGGYTRSRVRQAKYTANQRFIEIVETQRETRQNVVSSWETLAAARGEIKSRKAQVEASRIAQEGVRQEAQLGTRTILDSLDADQEYLDSQVALVTAQRDEIVASFALARALGILTPKTLGFSDVAYDSSRDMQAADWKMIGMNVDRVE